MNRSGAICPARYWSIRKRKRSGVLKWRLRSPAYAMARSGSTSGLALFFRWVPCLGGRFQKTHSRQLHLGAGSCITRTCLSSPKKQCYERRFGSDRDPFGLPATKICYSLLNGSLLCSQVLPGNTFLGCTGSTQGLSASRDD
jgi:hypothetical protein